MWPKMKTVSWNCEPGHSCFEYQASSPSFIVPQSTQFWYSHVQKEIFWKLLFRGLWLILSNKKFIANQTLGMNDSKCLTEMSCFLLQKVCACFLYPSCLPLLQLSTLAFVLLPNVHLVLNMKLKFHLMSKACYCPV